MSSETQTRIASLNSQVRQKQNRISVSDQDLYELRAKLSRTEEAQRLHSKAAAGFQSDGNSSMQSVHKLRSLSDIKLAQGYADSFSAVVNGAKNDRAWNAFDNIGISLRNEIRRLEDEICSKEAEISSLQGQISRLRGQINDLYAEV